MFLPSFLNWGRTIILHGVDQWKTITGELTVQAVAPGTVPAQEQVDTEVDPP